MDARELRIGNFILGQFVEGQFIPVEVELITTDDVSVEPLNKGHQILWNHSLDQVKPIPLTEEWLSKLGFDKRVSSHERTKYTPVFDFTEGKLTFEGLYCPVLQLSIRTVHQLQNLYFALTGEELTLSES